MLVGNVENEAGFIWPVLLAYTFFDRSTVDTIAPLTNLVQPILDIANLVGFTCGARQAAGLRVDQGVTAYRYRFYGGNYTNLYVNYVGADYHTSELPVVFGTASWLTGIQDTPAQASMGAFMRNAWAEFARDPEDGLANLGWPKYNPDGKAVLDLLCQCSLSLSCLSSMLCLFPGRSKWELIGLASMVRDTEMCSVLR